MQAPAPIAELRFVSGGTITYGWQQMLARYRQCYPDKAAMGTLAFTDLVVSELAPDAALVFGRWQLTPEQDAPHGLFMLTWKKTAAAGASSTTKPRARRSARRSFQFGVKITRRRNRARRIASSATLHRS